MTAKWFVILCYSLSVWTVEGHIELAGRPHKQPHFVEGHDVIVHLFEWRWEDVARECEEFLGPKGFGGVQISPVQENVVKESRPWAERYQPVSFELVTRSGNESELEDMLRRCNAAGVRVYVDIIINHMASDQPSSGGAEVVGSGGSLADPPSRNYYKVPFTRIDFNDYCVVNTYEDANVVRNCELFGLHDLNQGVENVRRAIINFMNRVIDLGAAGFRVDAAKHMWPGDLSVIYSSLHNLSRAHGFRHGARPFIYQEVVDGGVISTHDYTGLGAITEFKYTSEINRGMRGNNPLKYYRTFGEDWGFKRSEDVVVFVDNHDTQRSGYLASSINYKDSRLHKMATAFMLAFPYGTPQVMSSFAFDDKDMGPPADSAGNILGPDKAPSGWILEHRWRQIFNMVAFRKVVGPNSPVTDWWDNGNNQIAFSRGSSGFIAINADSYDLRADIHTQLPPGTYCDVISGDANMSNKSCTGKVLEVNADGYIHVEILLHEEDGVVATHKNAKIR